MQEHVFNLEAKVRDHEDYNSELQEVEKWLLQMSGRLVAPDLLEASSLETITQQLAHHKVQLPSAHGGFDGPATVYVSACVCAYVYMHVGTHVCICMCEHVCLQVQL